MKRLLTICAVVTMMLSLSSSVLADTIQIKVQPGDVPDETQPRVNVGDAPAGFGPDSWQGPATGKTNWHARYLLDGDALSTLFPVEAATLSINDIERISYYTKRPAGTPAGRDWWVQIYTRPFVGGCSGWYGYRFINNYNDHTDIGNWVQYATDDVSPMTFNENSCVNSGELTLVGMKTTYGTELVEMFSVQTDSGWNGFDGYMDGLEITLINGNVGQVNFVPEPTTVEIDIKPGSYPNSINPNAGGVIPVAILTTDDFDASTVDPETVALEGAGARGKGKSGKFGSIEDVDGDGDLDLVVQIENTITWAPDATEATLTGETNDGFIKGTDTVNIVPPE